jgi:hypothetical protein
MRSSADDSTAASATPPDQKVTPSIRVRIITSRIIDTSIFFPVVRFPLIADNFGHYSTPDEKPNSEVGLWTLDFGPATAFKPLPAI